MNDMRIMIVDDSPFQIAILREALESNGFNVVGEASSLEEVKAQTKGLKPNLVTMDMTIPGTDGFECTEAIHEIDPSIKVVIISSMMDDELINKAKKLNVSGYLQKPVDPEELSLLINRVMGDEKLYEDLIEFYPKAFKESVSNIFNRLLKELPVISDIEDESNEIVSEGISIIMGIIGKYSGRVILDMSLSTATYTSEIMLRRKPKDQEEILNVMSEVANMFAGNACSIINKKDKVFGLRVAPPTTFHGESICISKAEVVSNHSYKAKTKYGDFNINVGFERGESEWMSII